MFTPIRVFGSRVSGRRTVQPSAGPILLSWDCQVRELHPQIKDFYRWFLRLGLGGTFPNRPERTLEYLGGFRTDFFSPHSKPIALNCSRQQKKNGVSRESNGNLMKHLKLSWASTSFTRASHNVKHISTLYLTAEYSQEHIIYKVLKA